MVVQDGAVIGSDGFGFAQHADGRHVKIPQVGRVVVEDDVEIGANTTIDRPAVGETRIGAGTKIDNLVQIAHGVPSGQQPAARRAGRHRRQHDHRRQRHPGRPGRRRRPPARLATGVKATGQTGIPNSIEAGRFVSGLPAIDNRQWARAAVLVTRLPEYRRQLMELQRRLAALESAAGPPPTPVP